jgi:hypothetical protein
MSATLQENAQVLFFEIQQALRWKRPALLIAVCSSAAVRKAMQTVLTASLQDIGQTVLDYAVSPATYDVPLSLARHPQRENAVFYVTRLNRGGGTGNRNAFRALNMRRELLVDYPTRVVFWLTRAEAKSVALLAPDFWAFRHTTVES